MEKKKQRETLTQENEKNKKNKKKGAQLGNREFLNQQESSNVET